ncbi:hypothetical protein J4456_02035 [Candidatus Pacearchaeota archaeon]|nr:hypothetical protein [Candidatus Pacearchaeota archaeon]
MTRKSRTTLTLTRYEGEPVIIYQANAQGEPILDPDRILVIKLSQKKEYLENEQMRMHFDTRNSYRILRYEIIEKDENFLELKSIVDHKLKKMKGLETRISGGNGQ